VQKPRRLDAAAWPVGATTGAASLAIANAGTEPLAIAGTLTGSNAAVGTRPVAVRCFDGMLDLTDSIHFVGGYGFDGSNDFLRRLRFGRLLFRDDNRFRLFNRRHRKLRTRPLAFPQDLRRGLRLAQSAAATAASGSWAQEKHEMRFLAGGVNDRCCSRVPHRKPDCKQRHRRVCGQRRHGRLACPRRSAVGPREQRGYRLRVERQRRLPKATAGPRRVQNAYIPCARDEIQLATCDERLDCPTRHAGGPGDLVDGEYFVRGTRGH
jgi:hypothetical protein